MKIRVAFLLLVYLLLIGCTRDPYSRFRGQHLHLIENDKELFWFSGIHSNELNHPMFEDIKNELQDFKPELVLLEGGGEKREYVDEESAILLGGEIGYTKFLADELAITVEGIEPSGLELNEYLFTKYDKEDVLAMYILRQINQKQREAENVDVDFELYFTQFTESIMKEGFEKNINITGDFISNILEPYIGYKADSSNWRTIPAKEVVYSKKGVIHDIWSDTIKYRDEYSINLIEKKLTEFDRIFIMMGFDHVNNQEKQLKELFKKH